MSSPALRVVARTPFATSRASSTNARGWRSTVLTSSTISSGVFALSLAGGSQPCRAHDLFDEFDRYFLAQAVEFHEIFILVERPRQSFAARNDQAAIEGAARNFLHSANRSVTSATPAGLAPS